MTEAQAYVEWLSNLLAEFRGDPAKCEAIKARDERDGAGLLPLLFDWYTEAHPDRVRVEHSVIESEGRDLECKVRAGRADGQPTGPA